MGIELVKIVKTEKYRHGICSINKFIGEELELDFMNGIPVEVSEEVFNKIPKSWVKIVEVENG